MNKPLFIRYFLVFVLCFLLGLAGWRALRVGLDSPTASPLGKSSAQLNPFGWGTMTEKPGNGSAVSTFAPLANVTPFKVPILMYHYVEVVTDERDTLRKSMAVNPVIFENQLKALRAKGYHFILPGALVTAGRNEETLPEKPIMLTFDDGYRDFYTVAYPILKRQQVPAINYIIYNFIGKNVNYMTEAEVQEIVSGGLVIIGSHTMDHAYLTRVNLNQVRWELLESRSLLAKKFGVMVEDFAYPGGYNNEMTQSMAAEAGYRTAVATQPGVATEKSNPFHLPRLRVGNLSPAELLAFLEREEKK